VNVKEILIVVGKSQEAKAHVLNDEAVKRVYGTQEVT